MRRHRLKRFGWFLLGLVLLYAPFALLTRVLVYLSGSNYLPDCHRLCLRMPIEWMSQPWMYPTMVRQPLYLVATLLLPAVALVFGPLFCGWMCPAGQFARECPARGITGSSPAEVRTHSCLMCLDCLHACPHQGLSYGPEQYREKSPKKP